MWLTCWFSVSCSAAAFESWPLFLYFKIDGTVFQVDGKQLLHAKVVVQSSNGDESGAAVLPPCLMLVFSCCLFRIFPLNNTTYSIQSNLRGESDVVFDEYTVLNKLGAGGIDHQMQWPCDLTDPIQKCDHGQDGNSRFGQGFQPGHDVFQPGWRTKAVERPEIEHVKRGLAIFFGNGR